MGRDSSGKHKIRGLDKKRKEDRTDSQECPNFSRGFCFSLPSPALVVPIKLDKFGESCYSMPGEEGDRFLWTAL